MSAPLENYLKTYRRRSGLSQDEMAFLLGSASGTKVSRYERPVRRPSLETALAFEAISRVPVSTLFAGLYRKVEKATRLQARLLARKLNAAAPNRVTARKLARLRSLTVPASTGARRHS